ncbi:hypothetical protein GF407_03935 [candidate division KSB1 bacterium]|nr:hypothetical protein [candidate division KSB1 bacterium]
MRKLFGLVLFAFFVYAGMGFAQMQVRTTGGIMVLTVNNEGDTDVLRTLSADSVRIKHGTAVLGMVPFSQDDSGVLSWSLAPTTDGQVLKWNSTTQQWEPGADDGGTTYTADGVTLELNSGEFSALSDVDQWNADRIRDHGVSTTTPTDGQVLQYNGTSSLWEPAADANTEYSAGTGMNLSGTTFNAQTTSALWNANALQGSDVSATAPSTNGQVLKWNATASRWEPGPDDGGTTYTGGTGITISGSTINADATTAMWNADALQGSDISATAPSTNGQVLKWNGTSNHWEPGTDTNTTYSAGTGMTLSGTTFNARATTAMWNADALQGNNVSATTPSSGQVLKWNGTAWTPGADDGGTTYTGGTGITISGSTINADATTAMWNADALQGNNVSTTTPSSGQVLKWNGTAWAPQSDQTGASYWNGTAGTGSTIDRTGDVIIGSTTGAALELSYDSTNDEATIQSGGGSNPIYIKGNQLIFVIP